MFENFIESLIYNLSLSASRIPFLQKLGVTPFQRDDLSKKNLMILFIIAASLLFLFSSIPIFSFLILNKDATKTTNYANVPYVKKPDYKGYLVELVSQPTGVGLMGDEFKENEKKIVQSHEEIKKTILKALNKDEFRPASQKDKINSKEVLLLGEYTTALNGLAMEITDDEAIIIRKLPGVKSVVRNIGYQTTLMDSVPLIKADKVWDLKDNQGLAIKGNGVRVAVIDSGIDITQPDFGHCFPRASAKSVDSTITISADCKIDGYDFVNHTDVPIDEDGHGTSVASVIASGGSLKGVAPAAKITAYKVCNAATCYVASILEAIDAAIKTRSDANLNNRVQIINMSLALDCNQYYGKYTAECGPDDYLSKAVDKAVDAGVVVVVPAGNTGSGVSTINSPGTARNALTVAAVDKNKKIASFSSRGPVNWGNQDLHKPDVSAPGVNICSTKSNPFLHTPAISCFDDKHVLGSGTSVAVPHVTGVAALIIQDHPGWSPQQVKDAIIKNAEDLGIDKNAQGAGLVNALAAITIAPTPSPTPTPTPTASPNFDCYTCNQQNQCVFDAGCQMHGPRCTNIGKGCSEVTPTPSPTSTPISAGTSVDISPSSGTINVGETTVVNVRIEEVSNLAGAEAHLTYDPNILRILKLEGGGFPSPDFVVQTNTAGGKIDYAAAQLPPHKAVSGSGVFVKITIQGLAAGTSDLNFTSVILADANAKQIMAPTRNGSLTVTDTSNKVLTPTPVSTPVPTPTQTPNGGQIMVSTDPSAGTVGVGQTVMISVDVGSVTNLWGAQVLMTYDPKVVEVINLTNGNLMYPDFGIQDFGNGQLKYIYAQNGQLRQPATGSGILFEITFKGVGKGQSTLQFAPTTKFVDRDGYSIGTVQAQNGSLIVN